MRAVILDEVDLLDLITKRRRLGLDCRDEVWEGELHMAPSPHAEHGRVNSKLGAFFEHHWEVLGLGRTYLETNVERPGAGTTAIAGEVVSRDFRVPDRSFLLPGRYDRLQKNGWILGGPDAVIEIVSPDDESRKKFDFYFSIGVTELILIDRITRAVEIHRAGASGFEQPSGYVRSEVLRTEFRQEVEGERFFLRLRRSDDTAREMRIGE